MSLASVIVPDPPPNFVNLSLLFCHLFIGGNFKEAQIFYHSDTFENQIIAQIDSTCSVKIPLTISNITNSILIRRYYIKEKTNHILQLNFLRPEKLTKYFDKIIEEVSTMYRVIIFNTDQSINNDGELLEHFKSWNFVHIYRSRLLIVVHDSAGDSIRSYLFQHKSDVIRLEYQRSSSPNALFNDAFGDKAFRQIFGVGLKILRSRAHKSIVENITHKLEQVFANYYFHKLDMQFVARMYENARMDNYTYRRHIPNPIYNELSFETEPIDHKTQ